MKPSGAFTRRHAIFLGTAVVALTVGVVVEVLQTAPVRRSMNSFTKLLDASRRHDLDAGRRQCSARYLRVHGLALAPEEGAWVGLPRSIDKNFQAWKQGRNVWLCPTNRIGPIYQFIHEDGDWKFDGLVGLLQPGNQVERTTQETEAKGDRP